MDGDPAKRDSTVLPRHRYRPSSTLLGGGVSEWPKEHASKACEGLRPPGVRIPAPPHLICTNAEPGLHGPARRLTSVSVSFSVALSGSPSGALTGVCQSSPPTRLAMLRRIWTVRCWYLAAIAELYRRRMPYGVDPIPVSQCRALGNGGVECRHRPINAQRPATAMNSQAHGSQRERIGSGRPPLGAVRRGELRRPGPRHLRR
jgi:hypothetical protein